MIKSKIEHFGVDFRALSLARVAKMEGMQKRIQKVCREALRDHLKTAAKKG